MQMVTTVTHGAQSCGELCKQCGVILPEGEETGVLMLQLPFITAERLFIGRHMGLTLSRLKESGVCCRTSREANGTPSAQGSAPVF